MKFIGINWRYAIGEFLIVVLGILTAFQLDACKENRDKSNLRAEYLADLEVSLKSDSIYYENAKNYFDNIQRLQDTAIAILDNGSVEIPEKYKASLSRFSNWYYVYISNAAFEDLSNSGRLNLIRNKDLRYKLIEYYQYVEFIKTLDQQYNKSISEMHQQILSKLIFKEDSPVRIEPENSNVIINFLKQKKSYILSYLGHRETCQRINNAIRAELKKLQASHE